MPYHIPTSIRAAFKSNAIVLSLLPWTLLASSPAVSADGDAIRFEHSIILPGVEGAFDHLAYDPGRDRLFLAAEDQGAVELISLQGPSRVQTLDGFGNPHNIVLREGSKTILVADSGPSKSRLISRATYRTIRQLPLALGANCTLYDRRDNRLYVTTGGDRVHLKTSRLIAVDPNTGRVVQSALLPSIHLQPLAFDEATDRLFVNMADRNSVAVVDRKTLRMIAQWSTGRATANSAIAFDRVHHRLFVVGEPGVMVVMDSESGRITQAIRVPARADDLAFDEVSHRLFVPGGDGWLGVYDATHPDATAQVALIATRSDARTGLYIPATQRYVLAAPALPGLPAAVLIYDAKSSPKSSRHQVARRPNRGSESRDTVARGRPIHQR